MAKTESTKIRLSAGDRVFTVVNYILLTIIMLVVLYPLIYIVSASFSSVNAVMTGRVWLWPVEFNLLGYQTVLKHPDIMPSFWNTVYVTVVGTVIRVAVTIMLAWPLSRKDLFGSKLITRLLMFTMIFSGGLIPTFLLINNLGMYNTYWALIIPGSISVYNIMVARTFFQSSIPDELCEAAYLDGCSDIKLIYKVVIPLSAPIIAVLVMFFAVSFWNTYFNAMIYIQDRSKHTLQVVLRNILIQNQIDAEVMKDVGTAAKQEGLAELMKYSLIVIASVPMLILYPFIQKHFVKGIMVGAIKG